jgi:hypothetical protein
MLKALQPAAVFSWSWTTASQEPKNTGLLQPVNKWMRQQAGGFGGMRTGLDAPSAYIVTRL